MRGGYIRALVLCIDELACNVKSWRDRDLAENNNEFCRPSLYRLIYKDDRLLK